MRWETASDYQGRLLIETRPLKFVPRKYPDPLVDFCNNAPEKLTVRAARPGNIFRREMHGHGGTMGFPVNCEAGRACW